MLSRRLSKDYFVIARRYSRSPADVILGNPQAVKARLASRSRPGRPGRRADASLACVSVLLINPRGRVVRGRNDRGEGKPGRRRDRPRGRSRVEAAWLRLSRR
jgi:hypothetical protein